MIKIIEEKYYILNKLHKKIIHNLYFIFVFNKLLMFLNIFNCKLYILIKYSFLIQIFNDYNIQFHTHSNQVSNMNQIIVN